MALAATCFERDESEDEVAALEWLESLSPPRVVASSGCERTPITCYVPVNDKNVVTAATLQSAPGVPRPRQDRHFPTFIPADPNMVLVWDETDTNLENHLPAIQTICENVIRIGHSSSFVQMRAEIADRESNVGRNEEWHDNWEPIRDDLKTLSDSSYSMRVPVSGDFARLRDDCGAERIDLFAELADACQTEEKEAKKLAKEKFEAEFGIPYRDTVRPPQPVPPTIRTAVQYQRPWTHATEVVHSAHYDSELLILSCFDGPRLDVSRTTIIARRLRDAAMSACSAAGVAVPEWLSGHQPGAAPTPPTNLPHVAFLPLPFAGYKYADGHLMGMALAIPKGIDISERGQVLGPLLLNENDEAQKINLKLGSLGELDLILDERASPPRSLARHTWVRPSRCWATVTPVVLDKFPKAKRGKSFNAWREEVIQIILESCERVGLPRPTAIDIDTSAWHQGIPRAIPKQRKSNRAESRSLGSGFPPLGHHKGTASKPQVHVHLTFAQPVAGPVFLGAGRFSGYGFFKPTSASNHPADRNRTHRKRRSK